MEEPALSQIQMKPIGVVRRVSCDENEQDRGLVTRVVIHKDLAPGLDGIEEWSRIYVILFLDRLVYTSELALHHASSGAGVFAARSPIQPNPIGLTLVELVRREENVLWVRGLDALDGTPVLDIKPYPDWDQGRLQVVADFRVPGWLTRFLEQHSEDGQQGR